MSIDRVTLAEHAVALAAAALDRRRSRPAVGDPPSVLVSGKSWERLQHALRDLSRARAAVPTAEDAARIAPIERDAAGGTASIRAVSVEIEGDADEVKRTLDAAIDAFHGDRS